MITGRPRPRPCPLLGSMVPAHRFEGDAQACLSSSRSSERRANSGRPPLVAPFLPGEGDRARPSQPKVQSSGAACWEQPLPEERSTIRLFSWNISYGSSHDAGVVLGVVGAGRALNGDLLFRDRVHVHQWLAPRRTRRSPWSETCPVRSRRFRVLVASRNPSRGLTKSTPPPPAAPSRYRRRTFRPGSGAAFKSSMSSAS